MAKIGVTHVAQCLTGGSRSFGMNASSLLRGPSDAVALNHLQFVDGLEASYAAEERHA